MGAIGAQQALERSLFFFIFFIFIFDMLLIINDKKFYILEMEKVGLTYWFDLTRQHPFAGDCARCLRVFFNHQSQPKKKNRILLSLVAQTRPVCAMHSARTCTFRLTNPEPSRPLRAGLHHAAGLFFPLPANPSSTSADLGVRQEQSMSELLLGPSPADPPTTDAHLGVRQEQTHRQSFSHLW